ncbi:uncharacterized endoplasmic reticulum membrane protein C16E8.02 [Eurytemora carolleeae]|uniref:uncharacterized endoplasmic reticulum membrane protein C16E8.02 n=1 Tax=Eurytemora carolleeae TaxID=1294199 RepID=UPI000C7897DC|nr:uncharacterized endoplasmic reticulum membrane protein C16E8.02 [Eurytemora carolleeae]|eukprot:XP_023325170.1 uncharacterized endoplasmic reticulum membrane protein C16E8.02-like [Eurytemora affinis]
MGTQSKSRGFFDLRSQFIFYASYHNNPANVAIHLFCIWNIVWSGQVLLQFTPSLVSTPAMVSSWCEHIHLNFAALTTLIYVIAYLLMDPLAGGLGAALMVGIYLGTGTLVNTTSTLGGWPLWQAVLLFHVTMWILQFIGHGVFEKRAPALLDSWDQAFITAPLFVLLEVLFFFGYKKQFYQECMVQVRKNIATFKKNH